MPKRPPLSDEDAAVLGDAYAGEYERRRIKPKQITIGDEQFGALTRVAFDLLRENNKLKAGTNDLRNRRPGHDDT